jgi:hypothetical protein
MTPGAPRVELKYDVPLLNITSNFNLRPNTVAVPVRLDHVVWWCKLTRRIQC